MASSKQWPTLAEGVFERISQQAEEQPDPTQASRLRRLQRHIKQTYNSLGRFRELVEQFFQTPPAEWECVVVMYQRELKEEFFDHVDDMIAREKGTDQKEQLLAMKARVQVLVQAFEEVAKNPEAMDTAAERFDAMLTKFQSLEQSDREIDEMSKRGEIDGALLFTAAKARAAANAQGSAGVQELMNCMYLKIKQASAKQKPPEMVVLEEAMAIEDEKERAFFLDEVFGLASSPAAGEGAEAYGRQGGKVNVEDLYSMICAVLQVFDKQGGVDPSSPKALRRLQEMQRLVWDRYLLSKTALPVDIEKQQELLGRVVEPEPRSTSSQ